MSDREALELEEGLDAEAREEDRARRGAERGARGRERKEGMSVEVVLWFRWGKEAVREAGGERELERAVEGQADGALQPEGGEIRARASEACHKEARETKLRARVGSS